MKSKLDMAHDWAMKHGKSVTIADRIETVKYAWQYADAMQAEADKRNQKPNLMAVQQTFVDGVEQPRYAPSDDWQPNWGVAPKWVNWWAMDGNGCAYWYRCKPLQLKNSRWYVAYGGFLISDCFNYQGDWKDSLRKRPSGDN